MDALSTYLACNPFTRMIVISSCLCPTHPTFVNVSHTYGDPSTHCRRMFENRGEVLSGGLNDNSHSPPVRCPSTINCLGWRMTQRLEPSSSPLLSLEQLGLSHSLKSCDPTLQALPLATIVRLLDAHTEISSPSSTTLAFNIFTSSIGRSSTPVLTNPILCTTLKPLFTLPNMVCFPSKKGVGARVMKNWLPLVCGPLFAILRTPAPVCFNDGCISSSNFSP